MRRALRWEASLAAALAGGCGAILGLDDLGYEGARDGGGAADSTVVDGTPPDGSFPDAGADADGAVADGARVCVDGGAYLFCDDFDPVGYSLGGVPWTIIEEGGALTVANDAGLSLPSAARASFNPVAGTFGTQLALAQHAQGGPSVQAALADAGALVFELSLRVEGKPPSTPYLSLASLNLGCEDAGLPRKVALYVDDTGVVQMSYRALQAAATVCDSDAAAQTGPPTGLGPNDFQTWRRVGVRVARGGCGGVGPKGSIAVFVDGLRKSCVDLSRDPIDLAQPPVLQIGAYAPLQDAGSASAWRVYYDDVVLRVE